MKRLAYITGSRAEYGIVKRLLHKLNSDTEVDLSLVVTAMHLSEQYGRTDKLIEADNLPILARIPLVLDSQNNEKIIRTMAECLDKFGQFFQEHHFDAVMVLGDRYEMLSVATAAAMHNIPIIHLHGGEQTLGNYDEFIRHCITKMARLHLVATEEYRNRVIQLGEFPETVINTGSLGAENSLCLNLSDKVALAEQFGSLDKPYFMVVFHPETLAHQSIDTQLNALLAALDVFKDKYDFIFIGSNADTGSNQIFNSFNTYTQENGFRFFTSVKNEDYLALIKYSQGLIGNTSSGLLEVPSLGVGTVNIGDRQKGRVRGESVIDVPIHKDEIIKAINYLLSAEFQKKLPTMINPYYQINAMENAYHAVKNFLIQEHNEPKVFYDVKLVS